MEIGQGPNWGCSAEEKKISNLDMRQMDIKYSEYFCVLRLILGLLKEYKALSFHNLLVSSDYVTLTF
jgi:hypothetical protein